jgi:BirA family transcriptional regulator, biotin operon repressor / biotin---[acetyl-CoA-carboxylase] ligase
MFRKMSEPADGHLRVLRILKASPGKYVSGVDVAARLGLSRTAIWKHIRKLGSLGYLILTHPREGYQLVNTPDLLVSEEILPILPTSWLGRSFQHFMQIGSTNDEAMRLAVRGTPHGTVVVAEEQTRGRGRQQRSWLSPPGGGIYFSMVFTEPLPVREAPQSTLVATLALVRVLRQGYGLHPQIKWPNDVLLSGRKIAGILAEIQSDQDYTRFLVIGIGINVNQGARELSGPFRYPATSISMELGKPVNRSELLARFLAEFEGVYEEFVKSGFAGWLSEYEAASAILGKSIRIQRGQDEVEGIVSGFTAQGALKLLKHDGRTETIWVGDVTRIESFS